MDEFKNMNDKDFYDIIYIIIIIIVAIATVL